MREERSQRGPQSTAFPAHACCGHLLALLFATSANATDEGPLEFGATYTGEYWHNTSGGRVQDSAYLDNLDITLGIDTKTLWGLSDSRIFFYGLDNNGGILSDAKSGDLQVSRNIEAGLETARLYMAWIKRDIANRGSVPFGLYDLNGEFEVLEFSGLSINSALGFGTDFGQTGRNGPSTFLVTSLALRLEWRSIQRWLTRLAVLIDWVPEDPDDRGAVVVQLGDFDDALLPAELDLANAGHRIHACACFCTADFEKRPNAVDAPQPRSDGNAGAHRRVETAVVNSSVARLFGRLGIAEERYNVASVFAGAGIKWIGTLQGRLNDQFGVALTSTEASKDHRDSRLSLDRQEVALELSYQEPINERVNVEPDIHYIATPGLDPATDDALALVLKLELQVL